MEVLDKDLTLGMIRRIDKAIEDKYYNKREIDDLLEGISRGEPTNLSEALDIVDEINKE